MNGLTPETMENAGFASGSALALLHVALNDPNIAVPTELLRNRLALRAAVRCLKIEGRSDDDGRVRDAFLLTKPGGIMGPGVTCWLCSLKLVLFRYETKAGKIA